MSKAEKGKALTAAYIPTKSFRTGLEALQEGLPERLDRSMWPTLSGNTQRELLGALRFLQFIGENDVVQQPLRDLVAVKPDSPEYKEILRTQMELAYSDVFEAARNNKTIAQLQEIMRGYSVNGNTLDKAIRFWLELANYVGIDYPPLWHKARGAARKAIRNKTPRGVVPKTGGKEVQDSHSSNGQSQYAPPAGLHPIIAAHIDDLARNGKSWDGTQRENWKKSFDIGFEYAYPGRPLALPPGKN